MKPWATEMKPLPIEVPKEPTKGEFMNGAEVETITRMIKWGLEYSLKADPAGVRALGTRLGVEVLDGPVKSI